METIKIDGSTYIIEKGLSQAIINSFLVGGDVVVKKHCKKCGFVLGQYTGRYPTNCPVCGDPFERADITAETFGAYHENICIAILSKTEDTEDITEGKFKNINQEMEEVVEMTMEFIESGDIKSKADLNRHIKSLRNQTYLPKGIDASHIRDNFSEVVKLIGKRLKKENVELK